MTTSAVTPSIAPALDAWSDVTVAATFKTCDAIGLTEVAIDPEPVSESCYLQILDAAIRRLIAYRDAYCAAEAEDAAPIRLPMPWHG